MIDFPYFLYAYHQPTYQEGTHQGQEQERFASNAVHIGLVAP